MKNPPSNSPAQAFIREWWSGSAWWIALRAGIFLAISFPPIDLPFMLFLGWMDLQYLLFTNDEKVARNRRLLLFTSLLLWNTLTTYWLLMATVGGGLAAILANSGLMTLALFIARAIVKIFEEQLPKSRWDSMHYWVRPLVWIPVWLAFEYGHHQWDLAWPWLTLANAWASWPWAIQWVEITGYLGASAWILIFAAWGYEAWVRPVVEDRDKEEVENTVVGSASSSAPNRAEVGVRSIIVGVILLVGPLSLSLWLDMNRSVEWVTLKNGPSQDVLIIQPNRDSYEPYGGYSSVSELIDSTASFTTQAITERAQRLSTDSLSMREKPVILWPENTLDGALTLQSVEALQMRSFALQWQAHVLTGVGWIDYDESLSQSRHPSLLRTAPSNRTYDVYNAAWHITPSREEPISTYKKANLVPAVERFPFAEELVRLPFADRLPWTSILGFGRGDEPTLFEVEDGQYVAPVICYDSVFSDWVRQYVSSGAQWIAVLTNDGWWGKTIGHVQHYDFARLRAIETRRPIVRAANSGTSGWIDPLGDRQLMSEYGEVSSHWVSIPRQTMGQTFFVKHGNLMGRLVSIWFGLCLTLGFFTHVIGTNKRRKAGL